MATLVDIEQLKRNIREIESSSVYEETSLAEEESKAFKKILKLASIREQASKKIHERLIKDGFSEQAVSNALGRATDAHIVDDERYAEVVKTIELAVEEAAWVPLFDAPMYYAYNSNVKGTVDVTAATCVMYVGDMSFAD